MSAVVLLIVLAILITAGVMFIKKKKPSEEKEAQPEEELSVDEKRERFKNILLNKGAKAYAMKKYCLKNDMLYNADTNKCEHTEKSCKVMGDVVNQRLKTLPDGEIKEKLYNYRYEWHPEVSSCVRVSSKVPEVCIRMSQLFDNKNATTDDALPYRQPKLICDNTGNCDKSFIQLPTCKISEEYCKAKGLDAVKDENGDVTCDVNLGQSVAENLLGSYFVRKFRSGAEGDIKNIINKAGDAFSHIW